MADFTEISIPGLQRYRALSIPLQLWFYIDSGKQSIVKEAV